LILVTGANGFIGRSVVEELSKAFALRCFVRKPCGLEPGKKIELFFGDILNQEDCERAAEGCDAIVHLAALVKGSTEQIMRTNVLGTKNLALAAKKKGVNQFVFFSSDTVLLPEKDAYGKSKELAEQELSFLKNRVIFRPTIVFGKNDSKNISRLVKLVESFPIIPLPGNGASKIQPIFVGDVAVFVRKAVELRLNGTFILAGSQKISMADVFKLICSKKGLKRFFVPLPLCFFLLFRPLLGFSGAQARNLFVDRVFDMTKTVNAFGYEPHCFEEKISELL